VGGVRRAVDLGHLEVHVPVESVEQSLAPAEDHRSRRNDQLVDLPRRQRLPDDVGAAADGDVAVGGGADVIRQALAAGKVDELVISTAPVILGAGKRLFEGFDRDMDLEVVKVYSSPYATHVRYMVTK